MNVLIIAEDFRKDQFVLKPIIEKMFADIGKPRAKVLMCLDPLLGGIDQATDWERIHEILEMYPMVDIFLLVVDRDGVPTQAHRPWIDLRPRARKCLEKIGCSWRRTPGRKSRSGLWRARSFPRNGGGATSAVNTIPRKNTSSPGQKHAACSTNLARVEPPWGREAAAEYKRVLGRCPEDLGNHCKGDCPNG